jgi:uncharacterized protein YraI
MLRKTGFRFIAVAALMIAVVALSFTSIVPARAASATINRFYATCSFFSVDVAVSGVTNDGGGFDKMRYVVTDGSGKTLYQEDSARQVNITDDAFAINLPYTANNQPIKNPITFTVVDLDIFDQPVGTIQTITYDAPCLTPSGASLAPDDFSSLPNVKGKTTSATPLYYGPGADMTTGLTAAAGSELSAVYRSADSQWIGVLVSTKNMVWIPAKSINVDAFVLPIQPQRIDPSQNVTGAVIPSAPVTNGYLYYTLRVRATPSTTGTIVGYIPYNKTVPVYGRSADGNWLAVSYGNVRGWVWARYVLVNNMSRLALPVVG